MAYLDRRRAEKLLSQAGLDALILLSPESFSYATGAVAGVGTMWRRAGAVAVLVPADASIPEAAIVSDLFASSFRSKSHITDIRTNPLWVESTELGDVASEIAIEDAIASVWLTEKRRCHHKRPATFDPMTCWHELKTALAIRGLAGGRVGVELDAVSAGDWPSLRDTLTPAVCVDASGIIARLKMIKSPDEITHLSDACQLTETGIVAIRDAIVPGISSEELSFIWKKAITESCADRRLTGAWDYIAVGPDPWGGNITAKPGDLIKVDVGCLVAGYTADVGRTFVLGQPSAGQMKVFNALMAGYEAGSAAFKPGVPLAEIHRVTQSAIRGAGFSGYTRGHFGHGLGAGLGSEEFPFIAAESDVKVEPGMVLAFECPWYITGLGGFIIESQFLATNDSVALMNSLPTKLISRSPVSDTVRGE